jgi:hypothetical protein
LHFIKFLIKNIEIGCHFISPQTSINHQILNIWTLQFLKIWNRISLYLKKINWIYWALAATHITQRKRLVNVKSYSEMVIEWSIVLGLTKMDPSRMYLLLRVIWLLSCFPFSPPLNSWLLIKGREETVTFSSTM